MKRILEIGCGQGFKSHVLSNNKKNLVVGIDLSKKDLKIAKKRYPDIKFMYMNAEKLSFKKNYFDEVHAYDILEHVDHLDLVLNEVNRILKKGGRFFINIPYHKSEYWLLKIRPSFHKEIHHVRIFKDNQLENMLEKRKFQLLKREYRDFLQHLELYVLFKRKIKSNTQLSIGSWRDNAFTIFVHIFVLYFNRAVMKTPLVYLPIWIVTLPVGELINSFGNKNFPRSVYYVFKKTNK
jgi:ubiquinone/menaquinone biosynthesis C-methylase UbiE